MKPVPEILGTLTDPSTGHPWSEDMRKDVQHTSLTDGAVAAITVEHLLHPHNHFNHPDDVVDAPHLSKDEKRAILASWASDRFAVESIPALRQYPGTDRAVTYDEVLRALKALDGDHPVASFGQNGRAPARARLDLRCFLPIRRRHRATPRRAK